MAAVSSSPSSVPVAKLERKNAIWQLHFDQWNTIDLLYEGGQRLKNNGANLLMKRPKELYDVYQERYRRLTYQDLLANAVRWYLAKMFENEPTIDGKTNDDRFAEILQDCDRSGTTFATFGRDLLETMILFRAAFVLIDKPNTTNIPIPINTRADEKRAGLDQPYFVMYDPRQVINWDVDQYGNLKWCVIKAVTITQAGPLEEAKQRVDWWLFDTSNFNHYQFEVKEAKPEESIWNATKVEEWAGAGAQATWMDGGPHALSKFGRVPVRSCSLPKSLWFTNACYLQLCEHLDYLNSYAWKLFLTCHPQLVICSEKELTGVNLGETAYISLGMNDKIEYLEPSGDTFSECRQYLELLRTEIYRNFHLQAQGRTASAVADGASGWSKELEMAPAIDILNAIGGNLRYNQQLLLEDYKAAAGLPFQDEADRPDVNGYHFDDKSKVEQIAVAQDAKDLGLMEKSDTLQKILYKRAAEPLLSGENEEDKAKVLKEIDAAPTDQELKDAEAQAQQDAFAKRLATKAAVETINSEDAAVAA